jgi:hypothetical protein
MVEVWMAGVWNRTSVAATVPLAPIITAPKTFTIIRKQYIANTKTTYSEEQSILKFAQSQLHVRIKDAYLRKDGFNETFHLCSEVVTEVCHL